MRIEANLPGELWPATQAAAVYLLSKGVKEMCVGAHLASECKEPALVLIVSIEEVSEDRDKG
jgi:hypothetical protein